MAAVGATAHEVDIRPSCMQMLKDIGHPFAKGKKVFDITFENVQAGERTDVDHDVAIEQADLSYL